MIAELINIEFFNYEKTNFNLRKTLSKSEQKSIIGKRRHESELCESNQECSLGLGCCAIFEECLTPFDFVYQCH